MRLTRRDLIATGIVAAIVVPYVGYVINGSMPFIKDPRGMAAVGVILLLAWGMFVPGPFGRGSVARLAAVIGIAALAVGIAAAWVESDLLLVPFIAAIVALWVLALSVHSGATPAHS